MIYRPAVVCLGNLTVDDLHLPDGTRQANCIGGDALYAALGARLWEERTAILAPVGYDLPEAVSLALGRAGFSAVALPRRSAPTIRNQVHYKSDGSRHWILETSPESFEDLSVMPLDIPTWALEAQAIMISAMSLDAQEACVEFLRHRSDAMIALDIKEDYIRGNEQRILDLVSKTDIFLPSEEEARQLSGREDWDDVARWFASLGPSVVAIKLADKGSVVFERRKGCVTKVPARRTRVMDPTGAGDAYCGGLVARYLHDLNDLPRAAKAGAVSAAFAVSGYGTEGLLMARRDAADRALNDSEGWLPATGVG